MKRHRKLFLKSEPDSAGRLWKVEEKSTTVNSEFRTARPVGFGHSSSAQDEEQIAENSKMLSTCEGLEQDTSAGDPRAGWHGTLTLEVALHHLGRVGGNAPL